MSLFDDLTNLFDSGGNPPGNTVDSTWGGNLSTAVGNVCNPLSDNYDPNDPSCYVSPESNDPNVGSVYYDPSTGNVYTQPQPQQQPSSVSINQGGVQTSTGILGTISNDILSALAIINKRPYVPTTTQPVTQQYGSLNSINPATGIPYQAGVVNAGGTGATIGATAESFIRNNTGILLLAGAAFLLLQMKPVSRR